jgi:hypothetical protein
MSAVDGVPRKRPAVDWPQWGAQSTCRLPTLAAVPFLGHLHRDLLPQPAAQGAATALVQVQPTALGRQPPVGGFGRDPHQPGRHLLRAVPEAPLAQPRPLLAPQGHPPLPAGTI